MQQFGAFVFNSLKKYTLEKWISYFTIQYLLDSILLDLSNLSLHAIKQFDTKYKLKKEKV